MVTNRRVLTWCCVHPIDENTSKLKKLVYIAFTLFCLAVQVIGVTSSTVRFLNTMAIDFNESLYALFQIAAISGVIYMIGVAMLMGSKISQFFGTLEHICDASMKHLLFNEVLSQFQSELTMFLLWMIKKLVLKWLYNDILNSNLDANDESFRFFQDANNKSERLWNFYFKLVVAGFPASTFSLAAVLVVLCRLTNKGFDVDYLYMPYKLRWVNQDRLPKSKNVSRKIL